ncbi:peptidoglycan DD-metalloendopeptidase family protein [Roseibaca sp. V10]|uniref:Peptidoglycan DD-metalloendopeptidase family protein n=1 Tax=Roseinatronobacter domitianus TaxID=2940293 RepID=A0ABT0LZV4_9RHOB|nr:peptidoglycan DD-metalloendopeptidase family protein [Roseibaca domitiana]MCL1627928.1 peptidoglycan DD-metalloendopeptidase family protein [Roseibaca domitiana]
MQQTRPVLILTATAILGLTACSDFDMDMRSAANGFSTADAARQISADRPRADARGIITYPDYQVVVARGGDTVQTVAQRLGENPVDLARYNALTPDTKLRPGEILALPRKLETNSGIAVTTLAETAINRAEGGAESPAPAARTDGPQPTRHRVERGETAFQIARLYNVSPRALADWNGLSPEMEVREGQVLMIPVAAQLDRAPAVAPVTQPGSGSPTPPPPSASTPMPEPAPPAQVAAQEAEDARPPSPQLAQERTEPAAATSFAMPVDGRIIRAYAPGRNDGIGIAASAGTNVRAAQSGTVAAITKTTTGVNILVLSHANNVLTVYANIDTLAVERGARVSRGQTIAKVAAGDPSFLHFEVRNGQDSVDPMQYLQ